MPGSFGTITTWPKPLSSMMKHSSYAKLMLLEPLPSRLPVGLSLAAPVGRVLKDREAYRPLQVGRRVPRLHDREVDKVADVLVRCVLLQLPRAETEQGLCSVVDV